MAVTFIDPAGKLLAHLPTLAAIQQGGTPPPLNCEIDLSNRCSLGCEWCHFAFTHTRGPLAGKVAKPAGAIAGGDLMDTALAKRIVTELADAGVKSLTWTGGGEPTLHPDFDELIQFTGTTTVAQAIYTHGGHINDWRALVLKEHMTFVYVSLDAANAAAYKAAKGVDRFDAACDGIRRLVAAGGKATVGVGFLVTRDNWRDAPDAVALVLDELGADYIQFRPTIRYSHDNPTEVDEDTGWMAEAVPMLQAVAGREGVEVDLARFRMYQDWGGHGYPTCWWSALQTCVTPNGKVWRCVNKREHPGAELGDLSTETFAEIWGRQTVAQVDGSCRVMCRGHLPNLTLAGIMAPHAHPEFV